MRKIISLVCVLALMFTVLAFTANAADNSVTLSIDSQTDSQTILSVTLNASRNIQAFTTYYDFTDAVSKGATVTVAKVDANTTARYVAAQKMVSIVYANTSGDSSEDLTGENVLATITLNTSSVTSSFTITKKVSSGKTITKMCGRDAEDGEEVLTYGTDYTVTESLTVNPYEAPSTTTVEIAKSGSDTAFLGADGGEYGSAFRITFDRPAAATSNDAIFGVTAGGTRKYSPKQTGVLAGLSGTVTLNVSFLNGSTAAGSLGVIEPKEVTAASVIMSDDAGNFFYTDEADAK